MIAANVEAARFVEKHKVPSPYRIHEQPDVTKIGKLREFLAGRALRLPGGDEPTTKDLAHVLAQAQERPDLHLIQTVMLRSLMQARYSATNVGHYGLALTHYAHFTSPIRRYPDLLLHRAIKHILHKRKAAAFPYSAEAMEAHCAHSSLTERRADEATRDVVTWLKCEFMRHRLGEEYEGTVTAAVPFGLFVELEPLYIEGLVHVSALSNDYYEHDPRAHRLVGRGTGMSYALGDRVRVKVIRVNLDERKIDLELVRAVKHSSMIQPRRPQSPRTKGHKGQRKRR